MKTNQPFSVGYARIDITPEESVPLSGYGNNMNRLSQGVLDPLFATCIAVTDESGNSVLLCTADLVFNTDYDCIPARDAISTTYGIPRECVVIGVTHTHSAPDTLMQTYPPIVRYTEQLIEKLTRAAGEALADRKPAVMQGGQTYTKGMTFVRHYFLENDTCAGDNFGDFSSAPIRDHVSEADRQIQLVKFCRDGGKDILMVNWQAHPKLASTRATEYGWNHRPYISADFPGACRSYVEEKTGMHFAYFQGACGNLNPNSSIKEENGPLEPIPFGQQLGDYILDGLNHLKPIQAGRIAASETVHRGPVNHTENHLLPHAEEISKLWAQTNDPKLCAEKGRPYGIHSPYHAQAIIHKAGMSGELQLGLGACCIGDLGFAVLPHEVFDTNGKQIKDNAPFTMTFILERANGDHTYIPSRQGFEHGCYEADKCVFTPGTGEEAADEVLELLTQLHQEL